MTTTELVTSVANLTGISPSNVKSVLDAAFLSVGRALTAGEDVALKGIGKLKVVQRGAKTGRNPKTGEPVQIAPYRTVKLSPAPDLKKL